MSVEKMDMMTVVGPVESMDGVLKRIVLLEKVHIDSFARSTGEMSLTLEMIEGEQEGMSAMVTSYSDQLDMSDLEKKLDVILNRFAISPLVDKSVARGDHSFRRSSIEIDWIYSRIEPLHNEIKEREERLQSLLEFKENIKYITGMNIQIEQLRNMRYFSYRVGTLSKDKRIKLKESYESISAAIFHIGSSEMEEVYLVVYPSDIEVETSNILKSLNFHDIEVPVQISGRPEKALSSLDNMIGNLNMEIFNLNEEMKTFKQEYVQDVIISYNMLLLQRQMERIKMKMAYTKNFFMLSGWVPSRDKKEIQRLIEEADQRCIVTFKEGCQLQKRTRPPTKLRNNWLTKPFENLVKLYGVPSYDELDPTSFLGITYMMLFGAMFGDVGQGGVLLLAGLYIMKKSSKLRAYAGILTRLGISSMVFGFLYGSIFGFEHILPALFIRPIENIDFVLLSSVVFGVVLLLLSFGYNIANSIRQRDIKEGVFGRNGAVGLMFYILLLVTIVQYFVGFEVVNIAYGITAAAVLIILMVLREPLSNLIMKKRPLYDEGVSEYYIESGFDIVETLLSMVSNTISFIRVGAFALNHVGLFLAFLTMARLIGNVAGSALVIIVGNVIIIALEGLIVLIQGLRLEYYELFSKYFKGEGVEFAPVKLEKAK
ncbi:V/A-type H+-transporting ATPase subunit I [Peptoclostridium litorale DSM 5388]|uniref:V-type ATP synthase subunit I n=1 Tax=Peptoclostridium litorale DSM 5388 TaxID=1121324 RepID=A0A069RDE0_PEPLI|nr:V-type ATPase 116kDa subunit family protein [Peptoclostridium litorale]KDR94778.1 V-type ATP synthase subunit I [Peptoclostridium litorale DSM 5388]SIN92489.1 V/A-type H+-transporting ATPase subunit I [Peptoclostridium litorale DSM 5388]